MSATHLYIRLCKTVPLDITHGISAGGKNVAAKTEYSSWKAKLIKAHRCHTTQIIYSLLCQCTFKLVLEATPAKEAPEFVFTTTEKHNSGRPRI